MLSEITIKNFKTISKLKLELGRVNIIIGENGAGKSNILEAIALAGAANANKLDNEFLNSRGIRVTNADLMRPAFEGFSNTTPIEITVASNNSFTAKYSLTNDNEPYSNWKCESSYSTPNERPNSADLYISWLSDFFFNNEIDAQTKLAESKKLIELFTEASTTVKDPEKLNSLLEIFIKKNHDSPLLNYIGENQVHLNEIASILNKFMIFSPENSSLRSFEKEGQIQPLGTNGEGLIKFLYVLSEIENKTPIDTIKENLKLFGWFDDFSVSHESSRVTLDIRDRFLDEKRNTFDQKSANEGFLFLAFYFAIFSSPFTPRFFAIDNVDTSLNPKLCQRLIKQLVTLAKNNNKQVILTTHNPAVLDGLDLGDEEQRLFAVSRGRNGHTKIARIKKPKSLDGAPELRLSEMFLRGLIGGLSKGF